MLRTATTKLLDQRMAPLLPTLIVITLMPILVALAKNIGDGGHGAAKLNTTSYLINITTNSNKTSKHIETTPVIIVVNSTSLSGDNATRSMSAGRVEALESRRFEDWVEFEDDSSDSFESNEQKMPLPASSKQQHRKNYRNFRHQQQRHQQAPIKKVVNSQKPQDIKLHNGLVLRHQSTFESQQDDEPMTFTSTNLESNFNDENNSGNSDVSKNAADKLPAGFKRKVVDQFIKSGGSPHNIVVSDSTITTTSQAKKKTITTVYKVVPNDNDKNKKFTKFGTKKPPRFIGPTQRAPPQPLPPTLQPDWWKELRTPKKQQQQFGRNPKRMKKILVTRTETPIVADLVVPNQQFVFPNGGELGDFFEQPNKHFSGGDDGSFFDSNKFASQQQHLQFDNQMHLFDEEPSKYIQDDQQQQFDGFDAPPPPAMPEQHQFEQHTKGNVGYNFKRPSVKPRKPSSPNPTPPTTTSTTTSTTTTSTTTSTTTTKRPPRVVPKKSSHTKTGPPQKWVSHKQVKNNSNGKRTKSQPRQKPNATGTRKAMAGGRRKQQTTRAGGGGKKRDDSGDGGDSVAFENNELDDDAAAPLEKSPSAGNRKLHHPKNKTPPTSTTNTNEPLAADNEDDDVAAADERGVGVGGDTSQQALTKAASNDHQEHNLQSQPHNIMMVIDFGASGGAPRILTSTGGAIDGGWTPAAPPRQAASGQRAQRSLTLTSSDGGATKKAQVLPRRSQLQQHSHKQHQQPALSVQIYNTNTPREQATAAKPNDATTSQPADVQHNQNQNQKHGQSQRAESPPPQISNAELNAADLDDAVYQALAAADDDLANAQLAQQVHERQEREQQQQQLLLQQQLQQQQHQLDQLAQAPQVLEVDASELFGAGRSTDNNGARDWPYS